MPPAATAADEEAADGAALWLFSRDHHEEGHILSQTQRAPFAWL